VTTSMKLGRFAALLAAIGGIAYAVEGAIVVRAPQGDSGWHASGYAVEAAFVIALLATIPLLPLLATTGSRAARVAVPITQVGLTAMLVSAIASLAAGKTALGPAFLLGVLATMAGLLVLTVAAVRRRVPGWWMAPATFAGLVLSMALGNHGGGILFGLAWIAISIALREPERPLPTTVNA
jgi:hypothetical protein